MTRNEARAANYAKGRAHATNARQRWTQEEDRAVARHDVPDRVLAERLGRSVQAIQVRRARLPYVPTCSDCGVLGRACGRTPS